MDKLTRLAALIRQRNILDEEIAQMTGRPALRGHLGDYLAADIFDIALEPAANKSVDGRFRSGPLAGRSVNVKWYALDAGILDIAPEKLPNYYLVLAGPRAGAASSRGTTQTLLIDAVYLFDAVALVERLRQIGVKIGIASSVRRELWREAQLYPEANNRTLPMTSEQRRLLMQFSSTTPGSTG